MWRKRHRLQRLESEIAEGKAERAELRRRLEQFEIIAAAAGASLPGEAGHRLAAWARSGGTDAAQPPRRCPRLASLGRAGPA